VEFCEVHKKHVTWRVTKASHYQCKQVHHIDAVIANLRKYVGGQL